MGQERPHDDDPTDPLEPAPRRSEPTGKVDVTFFEPTKTRKHWQRTGNRFMMAPWSTVVATFNPRPTCRVIVRSTSEAF